MSITTGKLFDGSHPDVYKKWVIGGFVQDPNFKSNHFEFKFQEDIKGTLRKPKKVLNPDTKTLAVLIYGHLKLSFQSDDIYLTERGDYILWEPDVPHLFEYMEDSLVITLRWFE